MINNYAEKLSEPVIPPLIREALNQAITLAYIPRDRNPYKVGAVLETKDGQLFTGSNVKLSCGLTMCAERVALYKALTTIHNFKIHNIYLDNETQESCYMCGVCLQAIASFTSEETTIICRGEDGHYKRSLYKELLPHPFINHHH